MASVSTYTTQDGRTVVQVRGGCTDKINFYFKTRQDALAMLKAIRKAER
jgi:hypothetical protein